MIDESDVHGVSEGSKSHVSVNVSAEIGPYYLPIEQKSVLSELVSFPQLTVLKNNDGRIYKDKQRGYSLHYKIKSVAAFFSALPGFLSFRRGWKSLYCDPYWNINRNLSGIAASVLGIILWVGGIAGILRYVAHWS